MNACEKMQIARLNLRAGRGRSLETLTHLALEELRRKRNDGDEDCCFSLEKYMVVEGIGEWWTYNCYATLRQARFAQLRAKVLYGHNLRCVDSKTGIVIF